MTTYFGTNKADHYNGGSGNDIYFAGAGNDQVGGGSGNDVLDGGAGSDRVSGDAGNDILVYVAGENAGATDVYDGGSGYDALTLVLTRAEWLSGKVQSDVARYLQFIARETNANNGQASNAEFRFTAFDLRVSKVEALFVLVDGVLVDPRDGAVTLVADAIAATQDMAGAAVDLLANDKVPDFVRAITHTQPAGGTVAITLIHAPGQASKAQAVYTPDPARWQSLAAGQTGTDSFTYTVTDADGDTATQTVTVTITGTNDGPVAVADAAAATENQTLTLNVLANDTDVDAGAVLTITGVTAPAAKGTVSIVDNKLVFATGTDFDHLAAGATEAVTLSYTIADEHGGTSTSTVVVTVTGTNDAPRVTSDAAAARGSVAEAGSADDGTATAGTPSATGALTSTDVDDGATATWSGTGDGAFGRFAVTPGGVWTYTLDKALSDGLAEGDLRTETFTATVADGRGGTATQVVTVTVAGTNDAPVVTSGPATGAVVGTAPTAAGTLTASDADAGSSATWSGSTDGTYGRFSVDAGGAWTYALDNARAAAKALGEGQTRTETFTAIVTDDRGATATQLVTIVVTGTNDAPVVTSGSADAGGAVVETGIDAAGAGFAGSATATGTLTASDADDGARTTWSGGGDGAFGRFAIDPAGVWTYALDNARAQTQALAAGEVRTEMFVATVTDDKGAVATQAIRITVTGTNDAPTIVADRTIATAAITEVADGDAGENTSVSTANGTIAFADVDASDLHAATVSDRKPDYLGRLTLGTVDQDGNAVGWTFSVDDAALDGLAAGETRMQIYDVAVSDGKGGTVVQAVTVTITGTNDAPTILAGGTTAAGAVTEVADGQAGENGVMSSATGIVAFADVDAVDVHAAKVVAQGSGYLGSLTLGAVDQDGNVVGWAFTVDDALLDGLARDQRLTQTYAVLIEDGRGGSVEQLVIITITGTNDAPVVSGTVVGAATEGGASSRLNALANASDVDSALVVVDVPDALPVGVTYDRATGTFTLDPGAYQSLSEGKTATVTVAYGVSDGIVTTAASVSWTVTGTNDAPVVSGVVRGAATEDGAVSTLDALANASDADGGATLSVVNVPDALPVGVKFDGTKLFALDPSAYQSLGQGQTRTVTVAYGISDGISTTPASVSWTVTGTNDAPVVTGDVQGTIAEDGGLSTLSALANASDVDAGAVLTVVDVPGSLPVGVAYDAATQAFTLDAAAYQSLAAGTSVTVAVDYGVSDGTVTTAARAVWTVTGANDRPVVTGAVIGTATEDGGLSTLNALANASDVDAGTALFVTQLPGALPAGVRYDAATATFTLDPAAYQSLAAGETASVVVDYQVSDGMAVAAASVRWTVTGANDSPVVTAADKTGTVLEDGATMIARGDILYADPDARGSAAVSVAPAPSAYIGSFTATLAENGRVAWSFNVDNAAIQYLAAGQTVTQSYQVTIDDGQGGSVTQSVSVDIVGANDEIVRGEIIGAVFSDVNGVRSGTTRVYFSDADATDVHSVSALAGPAGYVGSATASAVQIAADGRMYFEINYAFPIADINALPITKMEQEYDFVLSDNAGSELTISRIAYLEDVEYFIGGAGNDDLGFFSKDRNIIVGNGGSDRLNGGDLGDALYGDAGPGLPEDEINYHDDAVWRGNAYDDLLDGEGGADELTGGGGADVFQFDMGDANGDIVHDFSRAEGDILRFVGWGEGATFSRVDATHWRVATADGSVVEVITFTNAAEILVTDYVFV